MLNFPGPIQELFPGGHLAGIRHDQLVGAEVEFQAIVQGALEVDHDAGSLSASSKAWWKPKRGTAAPVRFREHRSWFFYKPYSYEFTVS
jgi:hypothetical protein